MKDVAESDGDFSGEPPAWANTRQELGDATPNFRIVQGGLYHKNGICWGLLLDADTGSRSYLDSEQIITRVSGGCEKGDDGVLSLKRNQGEDDKMVKLLKSTMDKKSPVIGIIGDKCQLLGRKLPHRFCVLAFFNVTHIWFEKTNDMVGAKVRFEKIDLEMKSWWATKTLPSPPALLDRVYAEPESSQCSHCGRSSVRVYREGWVCLQPSCPQFWSWNKDQLTFSAAFLNSRRRPDEQTQPKRDLVRAGYDAGRHHMLAWREGIVCPLCRRCISRKHWKGWRCSEDATNPCTYEKVFNWPLVQLNEVQGQSRSLHSKRGLIQPEVDTSSTSVYRKRTYTLPNVGTVTHFIACEEVNGRPNGADDIFMQLQQRDLGLKRFELLQSVVPGTLTAHFAVNYGMPYKYVVAVDSKPFSEAPSELLKGLGLLKWATDMGTSGSAEPPNEMLVLGYLEGMKIGYHDDGEKSLGPTIATLSIGSKSNMSIRVKSKYYFGTTKAKPLDDDPAPQGCLFFTERTALKEQLLKGEITRAEYNERRRSFLKPNKGTPPPLIQLDVRHGDLVVMDGVALQKYYEHSVTPTDKLRYALTARHIKLDHVPKEDQQKGEFKLSPDQVFDGQ
ncbi:hypothetical protein BDV25DRAFT_168756 [Aspergillus avenaceus]|uniref:Fe2OG dioxygenase domain-containing protein n=1 Tax=Aspergillus avenaceus TaxID=36643 RepID=A0A5N6U4H9_ASPAV|nr:hypothetical protein BDV25DRAFT_168756 [Aspergillus avenaceus]